MSFVSKRRLELAGLLLCVTCLWQLRHRTGRRVHRPAIRISRVTRKFGRLATAHEDQVQSIDEFVRPGQTVENWTELVTVQRHRKTADLGSVDDQIAAHHTDLVARCPDSTVEVIRRTPDGVLYEAHVVNCQQGAD